MGSCNFKSESLDTAQSICKSHFQFHYGIGKGGFGKVWRVELKKTKESYAMKEMSKARILSKKSVNSVINERKLLSYLKHPYIVNMQYAFQDRENLYLVMDLMKGGDLRFHINQNSTFDETQSKFFAACIVTGLEYLHVNSIIHRDIKPENLVLDNKGYLRITDFGIARLLSSDNSRDTSGTPGYMAPEILNRQRHGVAVDYFALGVIMYEFMIGRRPYLGRNRKEIKEFIMARQVKLVKSQVPAGWSLEAVDFINKLLQRNPEERLGKNGILEIKNHSWVSNVQWKKMLEKKENSPCKSSNPETLPNLPIEMRRTDSDFDLEHVQKYFNGYKYQGNKNFGINSTILKKSL